MTSDTTLFVMFGQPRSGSSHLGSLLGSHPDITYLIECFNMYGSHHYFSRHGLSYNEWHYGVELPLERIVQRSTTKVIGFKLFEEQHPALFQHMLENPHIKKILIFRKSYVENYVSWLQALKTGNWSSEKIVKENSTRFGAAAFMGREETLRMLGYSMVRFEYKKCCKLLIELFKRMRYVFLHAVIKDYDKVKIRPRYFRRYVKRVKKMQESMFAALKASNQDYCLIYYEDLVGEQGQLHLQRVLDFLGVDKTLPLSSTNVKINPTHLKDRIRNYEQFCKALRGTEHEF